MTLPIRRKILWGLWLLHLLGVPALLIARHSLVVTRGWQATQWAGEPGAGTLLHESLTRHPRVHTHFDGFLSRPGGITVEYRGHFLLAAGADVAFRVEASGPTRLLVDDRLVVDAKGSPGAEGTVRLAAGVRSLVVQTELTEVAAGFRGWMAFGERRVVRLEDLTVWPDPVTSGQLRTSQRFRNAWDPVLMALAVSGLAILGWLVRCGSAGQRRRAEILATASVLSLAFCLPHGAALGFWGTALWQGAGTPWGIGILLLGLVPWILAWKGVRLPRPRAWLGRPLVAGLATVLATWVLRDGRMWGDGWITLAILERRHQEGPFGAFFWKEPLDRTVAVIATKLAGWLGADARDAVAATSCLAGGWLAWTLARYVRRDSRLAWEAAAVATAGGALLFFGHVENYAWVTAALIAFLLAARSTAAEGTGAFRTGVLGGLATAFHPVAALQVAPVFAVLVGREIAAAGPRAAGRRLARVMGGGAAMPLLVAVAAHAGGIAPLQMGLNSFAGDPEVFLDPLRALSGRNLLLALNRVTFLLSPGILFGLVVGLARPSRPRGEELVLGAAAAGAVFHLVFLNAKIAPAVQDWDIFGSAYPPLAMIAGRALAGAGDTPSRAWATGVSAAILAIGIVGGL